MPERWKAICHLKPYIQPFERELALRELGQIAKRPPTQKSSSGNGDSDFLVDSVVPPEHLISQLAYWESVSSPEFKWTKQLLREATTYVVRNGINPANLSSLIPFRDGQVPVPNRRCLRYGPHDIHEYRGKFFPQLVRALLNMCDLKEGDVVLDPMCGSGTTLVEANLSGYNTIGIDLNPLSVMISRTKCAVLQMPPAIIIQEYERIHEALLRSRQGCQRTAWFENLPKDDQRYLSRWFAPDVLAEVELVASVLNNMDVSACRDLFWLCLSDVLRTVSWQKTDDLRVRRDVKKDTDIDVIAEFLAKLSKTVRHIVALLLQEERPLTNDFQVVCGDARSLPEHVERFGQKIHAVITSPPYATALPYLDTDRLSLCYLKLLPRNDHRITDYQMVGNREITEGRRVALWNHYLSNSHALPSEISTLIETIGRIYSESTVGFRRRNLPALLAKYFFDMREVLAGIRRIVEPRGHVFVVVGDNHTMANGEKIEIATGKLFGLLGISAGLTLVESIPMEMLRPRDIFKKNSVASEQIIHFRLPG